MFYCPQCGCSMPPGLPLAEQWSRSQMGMSPPSQARWAAAPRHATKASKRTVEGPGLAQRCGWRSWAPCLGDFLFGVFCFFFLFSFTFTDVNHHAWCGFGSCVKFIFLSCGGKQQRKGSEPWNVLFYACFHCWLLAFQSVNPMSWYFILFRH